MNIVTLKYAKSQLLENMTYYVKNRAYTATNYLKYQKKVVLKQTGKNLTIKNIKPTLHKQGILRQENSYQGWQCYAGLESLMIDAKGDVYVATCRGKKLGNIFDDFEMPTEPVICPKTWCACAADLNTSKAKDAESAKYLRINNEQ